MPIPPPQPPNETKDLLPDHKLLKWWSLVDPPTFWTERYSIYESVLDAFGGPYFKEIGPSRFSAQISRLDWERLVKEIWDVTP